MGNSKFRLSDMIPNSWFYKLKDMATNANTGKRIKKAKPYHYNQQQTTNQPVTPNRASYYISPKAMEAHPTFWEQPRRSKRKPRRRQLKPVCTSPSPGNSVPVSARCRCQARQNPAEPETGSSETDFCTCRVITSPTDIIIDITEEKLTKLPPIVTKSRSPEAKPGDKLQSPAGEKKRLKTRVKSPKIVTKKTKNQAKSTAPARRSDVKCGGVLDGFAVVKSSDDPHRDFRESMVEMIVENNIRRSKDLEELLACYLSLNSAEYHGVIVKVFEQIWFDLN